MTDNVIRKFMVGPGKTPGSAPRFAASVSDEFFFCGTFDGLESSRRQDDSLFIYKKWRELTIGMTDVLLADKVTEVDVDNLIKHYCWLHEIEDEYGVLLASEVPASSKGSAVLADLISNARVPGVSIAARPLARPIRERPALPPAFSGDFEYSF